MYVKQVEITNIRAISKFKMTFARPAGWHVLIGNNGVGKTTILRSIALALMGYNNALSLQEDWHNWLNQKSESGTIKLQILRDEKRDFHSDNFPLAKSKTISNEATFIKRGEDISFSTNTNLNEPNNPQFYNWSGGSGWFSAGYGSFRRFTGGSEQMDKLLNNSNLKRLASHLSLFRDDVALSAVTKWLQALDYQNLDIQREILTIYRDKEFERLEDLKKTNVDEKVLSDELEKILENLQSLLIYDDNIIKKSNLELLKIRNYLVHNTNLGKSNNLVNNLIKFINFGALLPNNTKLYSISSEGVLFTDGNGNIISITQLSEGYRSILSLTFELIRQLVNTYGEDLVFENIKNDVIKINLPGVVLIDEIDAHLHPTWQIKIGKWFTDCFPKIQFIVTTHSPLICRASEKGSIWRLADLGSDMKPEQVKGTEKNRLIFGNILDAYGTDVFGTDVTISKKSLDMREELVQLNKKKLLGVITPDEEVRLNELRQIFTTDDSVNE
jgi:predicted ATPase